MLLFVASSSSPLPPPPWNGGHARVLVSVSEFGRRLQQIRRLMRREHARKLAPGLRWPSSKDRCIMQLLVVESGGSPLKQFDLRGGGGGGGGDSGSTNGGNLR